MKRVASRTGWVVFLTAAFWGLTLPAAHAYIDPNSTSFIVQILVGGLVGGALAIKTFGRRIWGGLRRLFGRGKPEVAERTTVD